MESEPHSTQESSAENQEKILKDKLFRIQLEYAVKLLKKELPFVDGEKKDTSFMEAVMDYTRLPREIKDAYTKKTGKEDYSENNKEYDDIVKKILTDISSEYGQNPDLDLLLQKIYEIIGNNISLLPQGEKTGLDKEKGNAGMVSFEVISGAKGMEEHGITQDDICLDIHFEAPFLQKIKQNEKEINIRNSFKELARVIKEKYQNAKAIIGSSWVLDNEGFAKKLGFRGLDAYMGRGFAQGNGFWGQFVDSHGQIKESEVSDFLKTGKPKYKLTVGYIPIDEFLKKYGE